MPIGGLITIPIVALVENVGQAILPADWFSSRSGRLKGGCGHDWPPHKK
jgi:hypothetical protein